MRWSASFVLAGLIALSVQAQSPILNGPSLGFTSENGGTAIRPIIGIPGASLFADRLPLETEFRGAVIAPMQNYAIALRIADGKAVVMDLRSNVPVLRTVEGVRGGGDLIAASPTGSVAAIYDHATKTVQVIDHVPEAPAVIRLFDASRIPGRARSITVNDDGTVLLARFADDESGSLWVMDSSGASSQIPADRASAVAFFPNSSNAVIADDASLSAFVLLDAARAATRVPLISAIDGISTFSSAIVSDDSRRVFFTDASSGNVILVDMETRRSTLLSCDCRATGLSRLKGNFIFRLNEPSGDPTMVLDASTSEPRIVIIPPSASAGPGAQ